MVAAGSHLGLKLIQKKSDVGKYFSDIATAMETVKTKLNAEVEKNGNYEKVKEVVNEFIINVLEKIASGAKEAAKGATGNDAIGGAPNTGQEPAPADSESVKALVKGIIKEIVGVVLKKDEGNAEASKTGDDKKDIGKNYLKRKTVVLKVRQLKQQQV